MKLNICYQNLVCQEVDLVQSFDRVVWVSVDGVAFALVPMVSGDGLG